MDTDDLLTVEVVADSPQHCNIHDDLPGLFGLTIWGAMLATFVLGILLGR